MFELKRAIILKKKSKNLASYKIFLFLNAVTRPKVVFNIEACMRFKGPLNPGFTRRGPCPCLSVITCVCPSIYRYVIDSLLVFFIFLLKVSVYKSTKETEPELKKILLVGHR